MYTTTGSSGHSIDPASYYEGATDPPHAKRRKTDCRPTPQDLVEPNSDMATHASVPPLSDVVEHDAHASETCPSSSHTCVSPHSAIDLLAAMGFTLPNGVVLERTQPTNPSDIALLSHLSDTLAKQR